MPATQMTTAEIPAMYRRLASAVGAEHWQWAVDRQEEAIRSNHFLGDYLRSEYAISYQLDRLRKQVAALGTVPGTACNDPSIFPSLAFAAQVLGVVDRSTVKQARAFIKRVRTAFTSSENMHGLRLELQAATHFAAAARIRGLAVLVMSSDRVTRFGPNGRRRQGRSYRPRWRSASTPRSPPRLPTARRHRAAHGPAHRVQGPPNAR